jgi:DNA-directed RNA polymerase subunit K/omega
MDHRYTRYEKAKMIGARAIDIMNGSPIYVFLTPDEPNDIVSIAEKEWNENVFPLESYLLPMFPHELPVTSKVNQLEEKEENKK